MIILLILCLIRLQLWKVIEFANSPSLIRNTMQRWIISTAEERTPGCLEILLFSLSGASVILQGWNNVLLNINPGIRTLS